ncbi:hypothetical protein SUDANB121_01544 [Nocardiopsis dassonvillei]
MKRQGFGDPVAVRAGARGGEEPVHDDQVPPVPGALVLQHGPRLPPRRVGNGAGRVSVLGHVADDEVLDHGRLVPAGEPSGELAQEVPAPVDGPRMDAPRFASGPGPVRRPLLLTGELPLCLGRPLPVAVLVVGVVDPLPGGQGHRGGRSRVHPHHGAGCGNGLDGVLAQQGHEPPSRRIPAHGHRRGHRSLGQRPRPHGVQGLGHLGREQPPVAVAEGAGGVLRRRPRPLARFEPRIPRTLGEEVRESRLEVTRCLLQRHRRHLGQERVLLGLLPGGEHRRRVVVGHPAPLGAPCLRPGVRCEVVDQAHTTPQGARQQRRLHTRGMEAILEGPLHSSPGHGSYVGETDTPS